MSDDFKKKDRDRKRVKYWAEKCKAVGLIPHTLDTEDQLRAMLREWKESKGKPVIHHEETGEPTLPEKTSTTVGEFYRVKKAFELDKDSKWERELQRSNRSGCAKAPISTKMQRIRDGESPLIFDIRTGKTKEFSMESDSDRYISPFSRKKKNKKEKSSWNF